MGCDGASVMAETISTRNEKSQPKIFLGEIDSEIAVPIDLGMQKKPQDPIPEIYLGDWLDHFNIGPTEAAKIAGCSQSYISNISRGAKKNVNALYLLRLSEHLGVNVNDFFRRLPSQAQLSALTDLSPKAQAALLAGKRKSG